MSEGNLVSRIRNGDGSAWREMIETHQESMFRLAYLILRDVEEAEDAAQEAFIRAYKALDSYDISRPLRPWLLTIVANVAKNKNRSISRYFRYLKDSIRRKPKENLSIEHEYIKYKRALDLKKAIESLNGLDQQIIYMRFFLNLSVKETAQALDIAEGTVKSRLFRALNRLREVIERDFPGLKEANNGRL